MGQHVTRIDALDPESLTPVGKPATASVTETRSLAFVHDAFISYRHFDNAPLYGAQRGWVDLFHERLQWRLNQLLGRAVDVWRDPRIPANDNFVTHLEETLRASAVFVGVLSPGYLKSRHCQKELEDFCREAASNLGLTVEGRARLFKVVKTPIDRDRHPEQLKDQLGFEFFEENPATKIPREFDPDFARRGERKYWNRLHDLAWEIKEVIERIDAGTPQVTRGSVFLAECASDLIEERDLLRRELQLQNYRVLPDRPMPMNAAEYRATARAMMSESLLSIHLVGTVGGMRPEGSDDASVVAMQIEVGAEVSRERGLPRLIWLPRDMIPPEPIQQAYLDLLTGSAYLQTGADLVNSSIEELKSEIADKLTQERPTPTPLEKREDRSNSLGRAEAPPKIYFIFDKRDVEIALPIAEFLNERHIEVLLPPLEDDEESLVIESHMKKLTTADGILVYYGSGNQKWLESKLSDIEKSSGLTMASPGKDRACICVGSPVSLHKRLFSTTLATIVKWREESRPEELSAFVELVVARTKGDRL
jgi:hypothetical protein